MNNQSNGSAATLECRTAKALAEFRDSLSMSWRDDVQDDGEGDKYLDHNMAAWMVESLEILADEWEKRIEAPKVPECRTVQERVRVNYLINNRTPDITVQGGQSLWVRFPDGTQVAMNMHTLFPSVTVWPHDKANELQVDVCFKDSRNGKIKSTTRRVKLFPPEPKDTL